MKKINQSAGLLLYRLKANVMEVLLVHPGGPFWKNKDEGAWSIPKGEFPAGEDGLEAAKRELYEETGYQLTGNFLTLTPIKQRGGKTVHAWALKTDLDTSQVTSNTFEMEWPPRSGKKQEFPEIDKAEWFQIPEARQKINPSQAPLIDELLVKIN